MNWDTPKNRAISPSTQCCRSVTPSRELTPAMLGGLFDTFSRKDLAGEEHKGLDVLGRVYEYCLARFETAEGRLARRFHRPECVLAGRYVGVSQQNSRGHAGGDMSRGLCCGVRVRRRMPGRLGSRVRAVQTRTLCTSRVRAFEGRSWLVILVGVYAGGAGVLVEV